MHAKQTQKGWVCFASTAALTPPSRPTHDEDRQGMQIDMHGEEGLPVKRVHISGGV
jgi:hypothetical protein